MRFAQAILVFLGGTILAPGIARAEEPPILGKKALFSASFLVKKDSAAADLAGVSSSLAARSIYWFGHPWAGLGQIPRFCDESSCLVQAVFGAEGVHAQAVIESALNGIQAKNLHFVTNERATFVAISGFLSGPEPEAPGNKRQGLRCEPAAWKETAHWNTSLAQIEAAAGELKKLDYNGKLDWVRKNLDCDPNALQNLGRIASVELLIDITNAPACPQTPENLETCFLARGVAPQEIRFEEPAAGHPR